MQQALKYYQKQSYDKNILGDLNKKYSEIFTNKSFEPLSLSNKNTKIETNSFINIPKAKYKNNYKRVFNPKQISSPFAASQIVEDLNERIWIYIDEYDVVQGPFTTIEMDNWYNSYYFPMDLLLGLADRERCIRLGDFIVSTYPFSKNPNLQIGTNQNFLEQLIYKLTVKIFQIILSGI